jgi:hypothetical protein
VRRPIYLVHGSLITKRLRSKIYNSSETMHFEEMEMTTNTVRIFDASKGYGSITDLLTFTDPTLFKRDHQWIMIAGGFTKQNPEINMFTASLPKGAPLSPNGWRIVPDSVNPNSPEILAGKKASYPWDGKGGRHCPSFVKGFDPNKEKWVERIYYAGASQSFMGPFSIGYLEWDGSRWVDQASPCFTPKEEWEGGSVYEPNLIYHEGKWKMWYVAGGNIIQGYAESVDGCNDWSTHKVFLGPEEKVFDFCVVQRNNVYEATFSRINFSSNQIIPNADPGAVQAGLWWCQSETPSSKIEDWSKPVRISNPGSWKPVIRYDEENDPNTMFVFYDSSPGTFESGMPIFTIDCLQTLQPESILRT